MCQTTIPPPPPPSQAQPTQFTQPHQPPQLPPIVPPTNTTSPNHAPGSPVAPEFSPITPKAPPATLATYSPHTTLDQESAIPPTQYIPKPPPRPFSDEDSTDAIALRAAISSLQFQKKKAKDDIKALEKVKNQAVDDPKLFMTELAAGRLKEQSPRTGGDLLERLLAAPDSDEEDEDEIVFDPSADTTMPDAQQTSPSSRSNGMCCTPPREKKPPFGKIPVPQNVVRMPYINWDKYHIVGAPLDALHEQQRRWPGGSSFSYGQDKGREHVVAAPYSPWLDKLDGYSDGWNVERRNDSIVTPGSAVTPTTTTSEHPMETRKRQRLQ